MFGNVAQSRVAQSRVGSLKSGTRRIRHDRDAGLEMKGESQLAMLADRARHGPASLIDLSGGACNQIDP